MLADRALVRAGGDTGKGKSRGEGKRSKKLYTDLYNATINSSEEEVIEAAKALMRSPEVVKFMDLGSSPSTVKSLNDLFPDIHYNGMSGDLEKSTYTVLNVCFPISNDKASMLDFHLDLKGIACSKGSACQSGSSSGSHVLNEIQNEKFKNLPSIRFSFSHNNSIEEVDYLIETLQDFINS